MKTSKIEEEFYASSGRLSSCIRTLSLGIIGVVWALSNQKSVIIIGDIILKWATGLAVGSLAFDVVHYLWRSIATGISLKRAEKNDKKDGPKDNHEFMDGTEFFSYLFWGIKILLCITSSGFLIAYFFEM